MQSDALDSYRTRLAANDAAQDLARERFRQAAASPTDEPPPSSDPGASAPASTPQHNDDDTVQPKSNTLLQLAVVLTMLCVGPWCETNDEFRKVIGICADHGVDSFFRTVPTKSRAVARAQLKAIMQRRLGIAIIRARVDAHLEALANLDPPHRAYFQNKGHLSQADTVRAWRPYDDLPPGWEGVVTPNASVKGDWG